MCAFLFWYNAFMHKTSHLVISLVLASLAALAPFAIDTYLPAFPTMAEDLHGTNLQLQQSLTAYLLPYAVMTLWHGAISDSIGRLAAIRWGLGVFALASVGCAFAPNIETLWFFRALQGASAGAGNVVARAMVRDLFEGVAAQRVMAQVQMIFGIAPAVAPIIGGWLLGIRPMDLESFAEGLTPEAEANLSTALTAFREALESGRLAPGKDAPQKAPDAT